MPVNPRVEMSKNHRRKLAAAAVVAAGLCLAVTPTSRAFQLHALHGAQINNDSSSSSTRSHAFRVRRSAATWRKLTMNDGGQHNQRCKGEEDRRHPGVPSFLEASRRSIHGMPKGGSGEGGGGKDVAALVLSALLLGNPRLADTAAADSAVSSAPNPVNQERLLEDLEQRLMKLPSGPRQTAEAASPSMLAETEPGTQEKSPTSPVASSSVPLSASDVDGAISPSIAAPAALTITGNPPSDPESEAPSTDEAGSLKSGEQKPLIKLQEYTFSVKIPELDVKIAPPVAPITVPAEGGLFKSALSFERVRPPINLSPPAGAVRQALGLSKKDAGLEELIRSIGDFVPKQSDYYRAVTELEERVYGSVKTVDHPLFAPGVPLAPEFTSMFSRAKEAAFSAARPYLAKGVEPELALFMLATLPVVTVALRAAADGKSRRTVEEPRPPTYLPPQGDQGLAQGGEAKEALLPVGAGTTDTAGGIDDDGVAAAAAAVATLVGAGAANLEEEVTVAADSKDTLRAELKRLQEELASATKLAAKVGALERANARLMKQVADLSRPPSPEEIMRLAEQEAKRAKWQKEREKRQSEALRSVLERTTRIASARETLAESFPTRRPKTSAEEGEAGEAEDSSAAPLLPAIHANAPSASVEKKRGSVKSGVKTFDAAPDRVATSASASASAAAGTAVVSSPSVHNGLERPGKARGEFEVEEDGELSRAAAASEAPTPVKGAPSARFPDESDDEVPEELSRVLDGVKGFDFDALDLEMDDLRPEDLEELHKLEREMGDLDMASLEAEFDKEDETISNALRMAAESALAHTSGDGRRIRTASSIRAASSRAGGMGGVGGFDGGGLESPVAARGVGTAVYDGPLEEEAAEEPFLSPAGDDAAAMRELAGKGKAGGKREGRDEWRSLSASGLKRKTVAQLKEFLDEVSVRYPSRAKKADLVALVCQNIAS